MSYDRDLGLSASRAARNNLFPEELGLASSDIQVLPHMMLSHLFVVPSAFVELLRAEQTTAILCSAQLGLVAMSQPSIHAKSMLEHCLRTGNTRQKSLQQEK
jgi:hypothetical protein